MKEVKQELNINKAKLAFYQMKSVRAVTIDVLIKAGSRYEPGKNWGAQHLLEHMSFLGSKRFKTELDTEIFKETHGIKSNAFTGSEQLGFWVKFPSVSQTQAVELLNQYIFESLIPQKLITKEINIISQEYVDKYSNPYTRFYRAAYFAKWGEYHPYVRDGIGQPDYIKSISRTDLVNSKNRFFQPKNMSISVVGNFNSQKIITSLQNLLNDKPNNSRVVRKIPLSKSKKYYYWHKEDVDQVLLSLVYKTAGYDLLSKRQQMALSIGEYILGGSTRSIFFQNIRMKKGLAYRTGAKAIQFPLEGEFEVWSSVSLNNAQKTFKLMHQLLYKFLNNKIEKSVFERSKKYIITTMMMSYDSIESIASRYSNSLYYEDRIITLNEYEKIINSITEHEVRDLISKYIINKKPYLAVLSKQNPQLDL